MDAPTLTLIREALSIGREATWALSLVKTTTDRRVAKIDAALKALESFHQEVPSAQTVPGEDAS